MTSDDWDVLMRAGWDGLAPGRLHEAKENFHRAVEVAENFDANDVRRARTMRGYGEYLYTVGELEEAEKFFLTALKIYEQQPVVETPDLANLLHAMTWIYDRQERYDEIRISLERALEVIRKSVGEDSPEAFDYLMELGMFYSKNGRDEEAEPLLLKAFEVVTASLGEFHENLLRPIHQLANLYEKQNRLDEAEALYHRAIQIREKQYGADHYFVHVALSNLAYFLEQQGRYREAEPLLERSVGMFDRLKRSDRERAECYRNLGQNLMEQEKYQEAGEHLERSLKLLDKKELTAHEHPDLLTTLQLLGRLCLSQGLAERAEEFFEHMLRLTRRKPETDEVHGLVRAFLGQPPDGGELDVACALCMLAQALADQEDGKKKRRAVKLYIEALDIMVGEWGEDSPDVAEARLFLAGLYVEQEQFSDARPLYQNALETLEGCFGSHHPVVLNCLEEYASMLRQAGQESEAMEIENRIEAIEMENQVSLTRAQNN